MIFLVSLVFVFIFYVFPLYQMVARRALVFPALGQNGSWLLTAGLIYVGLAVAAVAVKQFEDLLMPAFPAWRRELVRRTGVWRLDTFGWRLSVLATILFLATDTRLVPLSVASAIGFASLKAQPVLLRPVDRAEPVGPRDAPRRHPPSQAEARPAAKPSSRAKARSPAKQPPPAKAPPPDEKPVARRFTWQVDEALDTPYDGVLELTIDRRMYERYAAANPYAQGRPLTRNYGRLVSEGLTEEIRQLADDFHAVTAEQYFSSYQEIVCVLAFVQSIPYADDQETKGREYVRWPIETLYDNVGDSDCKSVLLAALLLALGYEVIVIEGGGRTAVGVAGAEGLPGRFLTYKGKRFYYCETSTTGWKIGRLPTDLAEGQFRVYPISPPNES